MKMRKSIALAEWRCVYCGEVGDSVDHIPPISARPKLIAMGLFDAYPFLEVRSCRECNSALGDIGLWTLAERKRHVKVYLHRRYARLLCMPEWSADELTELGPGLQGYVASGVRAKIRAERRVNWK